MGGVLVRIALGCASRMHRPHTTPVPTSCPIGRPSADLSSACTCMHLMVDMSLLGPITHTGLGEGATALLKLDCELPICASVKARGGLYEVFAWAEEVVVGLPYSSPTSHPRSSIA